MALCFLVEMGAGTLQRDTITNMPRSTFAEMPAIGRRRLLYAYIAILLETKAPRCAYIASSFSVPSSLGFASPFKLQDDEGFFRPHR